jgi:hypothetical protein
MLHVKDAAIGGSPAWSSLREIPAMIAYAPHLRRTLGIALVVGSLFVLMNQLGALLSGQATPTVWMKAALTYVVPFCVSNYGMLTATHRSRTSRPALPLHAHGNLVED